MSSVRKGDWNPSLLLITSGESDDGFDGIDKYLKFYPATVIGTDITNHNVLESIQNKLFTSYFGTRPISGFIPNGNNPLILDNVFEHSNNLPYLLMERIIS